MVALVRGVAHGRGSALNGKPAGRTQRLGLTVADDAIAVERDEVAIAVAVPPFAVGASTTMAVARTEGAIPDRAVPAHFAGGGAETIGPTTDTAAY
jgi:hypothetical protein